MPLPRMMRLAQTFDTPQVTDVPGRVRQELARLNLAGRIKPGQSAAISVGSRGIANLALIIKTLVEELKAVGVKPFVVPAMGSHGGGTAEGQRAIVEGYGVTEDYIGAPVKASMEVVRVGQTEEGVPVYFDKYAFEADHVIVAARIKPHTDFRGDLESGLHKMLLIGLGKHEGAKVYHQAFIHYSFDHIVRSVARSVIDKCHVLLGLALVENQRDETALIEAVAPEDFLSREKELLVMARKLMPCLPFDRVDLLIVDEIGKNISGTGLDTNVVGRKTSYHRPWPDDRPKVTRIYARGLTEETHGNATGLGIADFVHSRLVAQMDREITSINCLTGNEPKGGAIPLHYDSDRQVLEAALKTIGYVKPEEARIVRIHNTLHLKEVLVSEAYLPEMAGRPDLKILEPAREMEFDAQGDLPPF